MKEGRKEGREGGREGGRKEERKATFRKFSAGSQELWLVSLSS